MFEGVWPGVAPLAALWTHLAQVPNFALDNGIAQQARRPYDETERKRAKQSLVGRLARQGWSLKSECSSSLLGKII